MASEEGTPGLKSTFMLRLEERVSQSAPRFLVCLLLWITNSLEKLLDLVVPPPQRALQKAMAFIDSQVIFMSSKFGIADILEEEFNGRPMPVSSLAARLGLQVEPLSRLLLAAHQAGFFHCSRDKDGQLSVKNSKLSLVLHSGHYAGLKPLFEVHADETSPAFLNFEHALRTCHKTDAETAFAKHAGMDLWDYFTEHPDLQKRFTLGMKGVDGMGLRALADDYKWSQYSRILDIGGASGSFLALLLKKTKAAGVVCDLDAVVTESRTTWAASAELAPLLPRVDFKAIDFFKSGTIPTARDGDCYLLRNILHDWTDEQAAAILQNVRQAIGNAKASLVIVEMSPMGEKRDPYTAAQRKSDLIMLCMFKSKERNREQWADLFKACGFRLTKVVAARAPFYVTVAEPADSADSLVA